MVKSLSLSRANCIVRWNALHAGGPPTPLLVLWVACGSGVRGSMILGGEGSGQAFSLSNDTASAVASRFKHGG